MDGAVDKLTSGQHQIARRNLLAQAAHRAAGDDAAAPSSLSAKMFAPIGHRGRIEHMASPSTAEQGHGRRTSVVRIGAEDGQRVLSMLCVSPANRAGSASPSPVPPNDAGHENLRGSSRTTRFASRARGRKRMLELVRDLAFSLRTTSTAQSSSGSRPRPLAAQSRLGGGPQGVMSWVSACHVDDGTGRAPSHCHS